MIMAFPEKWRSSEIRFLMSSNWISGRRVEIDCTELNFKAVGESFDVTVQSEGEWRLAGRKTWCHPSVERGRNGDVVTFTADPNSGYDLRSETFTFVCGSRTVDLTVSQQPSSLFDAGAQREFGFGPEGGDVTLVVASNLDYTYRVESETPWLLDHNGDLTRGVSEDWLYFEVPANDTYGPREARIIFEAEGMEPVTVDVSQEQNVGIRLTPDRFEFQNIEAHRIEVEVLANVPYTIDIPETCDWVTLVEIPDANFRDALFSEGFILDASSTSCELTEVGLAATSIDFIPGCQIADLTGIEAFENLETLYCAMNQITHLDLSKNLALKTVMMSYNPLEEIILGDVNLTTLSLSGSLMTQGYPTIYSSGVRVSSSKLQTVDVSNNSQLTLLDVSDCLALTTVKARNCKYGKMVIRMRRAQEGTVSVDKDYTAKIEYVD